MIHWVILLLLIKFYSGFQKDNYLLNLLFNLYYEAKLSYCCVKFNFMYYYYFYFKVFLAINQSTNIMKMIIIITIIIEAIITIAKN